MASPSPGPHPQLAAVSAVSATDAWAVGTTIEHWDGVQWTVVPSGSDATLSAVLALGSSDVWAAGTPASGTERTLTEHWDGSTWTRIPSPSPGRSAALYDLISFGPGNPIWAIGTWQPPSGLNKPLIEEWDGSRWSLINAPSGAGGGYLFGGVSLAPDDAWMVGQTASIYDSPLTEHWDGSRLTVVPTGYTRPGSSFNGVAATSPTGVFAVGANRFSGRSFAENWDGTQWAVVRAPEIGVTDALNAVTVGAGGVPWAVGSYSRDRVNYDTLAERWDGTAWGVVQTPNGPTSSASLSAVTPVPGTTEMWAVGLSLTSAGGSATLIELYS